MNKYEQLIEHIINDEEDQARQLFHEIVVEKSRNIYESLMDEEYAEEGMRHTPVESLVDEITMDENGGIGEGEIEEMMGMDDEKPMNDMEMADEEDLEQKVMDLESELEALKAEFEQLMGDDDDMDMDDMDMDDMDDDGMDMDDMDMDDMDMDDMDRKDDNEMYEEKHEDDGDKDDKEEQDKEEHKKMHESAYESRQRRPLQKTAVDLMREYVEKISSPSNTEGQPAGTSAGGDHASVNTQSTVAGKNDMGGTAKNLVQGASENVPDGTSAPKKGTVKDLPHAGNFENVPGAKAGNTFSKKEKAKSGEEGGINKHSIEPGGN